MLHIHINSKSNYKYHENNCWYEENELKMVLRKLLKHQTSWKE